MCPSSRLAVSPSVAQQGHRRIRKPVWPLSRPSPAHGHLTGPNAPAPPGRERRFLSGTTTTRKRAEQPSSCPDGWHAAGLSVPIRLTIRQQQYARRAGGVRVARFTYNPLRRHPRLLSQQPPALAFLTRPQQSLQHHQGGTVPLHHRGVEAHRRGYHATSAPPSPTDAILKYAPTGPPSARSVSPAPAPSGPPLAWGRYTPHKWAVGTTFEWEFEFPMPTNPFYEAEPETNKPANPKAKSTRATNIPKPAVAKPAKPKAPKKPKRARLTVEERQERARVRAAENRTKLKDAGLCKDCRNAAIPGQTRCPDCAEQHRQSRQPRQSKQNDPNGSTT